MQELRISYRTIAEKIATSKQNLSHVTIWAWTRSPEGTPPTSTYTEEINRKLAEVLQLTPELLAQAYEESRRHLIIADKTAVHKGPLSVLRRLFADSKQKTWTSEEIVRLIDDLQGM